MTAKDINSQGSPILCEHVTNIVENIIEAILGNPLSLAKLLKNLSESPYLIQNEIFFFKFNQFITGITMSSATAKEDLSQKLREVGEPTDNAFRLIEYISRAETKPKIQYLINITINLLHDQIDLSTYFRICALVIHTLDEDLLFLKDHFQCQSLPYSISVQGLLSNGLMHQSVMDASLNGNQQYRFTPIAKQVRAFALISPLFK